MYEYVYELERAIKKLRDLVEAAKTNLTQEQTLELIDSIERNVLNESK
jgi:hypothetical protein